MRDRDHCNTNDCLWLYRFELIGVILLVIGALLTLWTLSDFGIGVMILVGGAFCLRRRFGKYYCDSSEELDDLEPTPITREGKVVKTRKKPPVV